MFLIDIQIEVFKKTFDYSGRAARREFWYFHLAMVLTFLLLSIVESYVVFGVFVPVTSFIGSLYFLITALPLLSLSIRRLNDINKSGFLIFLNLIPVVGSCILLAFYCFDSHAGVNYSGENPKGVKGPLNRYQKVYTYLEGYLKRDELRALFDWDFEEKKLLTRLGKSNMNDKPKITRDLIYRPFKHYLADKISSTELEHIMQIIEFSDEFVFDEKVSSIIKRFSSQSINGEITKENVEEFWSKV